MTTPLEVIKESAREFDVEFEHIRSTNQHIPAHIDTRDYRDVKTFHKAQTLALLQALRAELEGRKNEHCGGRKDCARGQCLTIKIRNKTIQDQIDSLDALIKEVKK